MPPPHCRSATSAATPFSSFHRTQIRQPTAASHDQRRPCRRIRRASSHRSPLHSSHSAGKISPAATDESPPARTQPANQPATLLAATLVAGQKQSATLPFPSVAGLPDVITGKLLAKNLLPSNKTSNILSPPPIRRRCLRYFPATFCHKALKCMTDSMNPSQSNTFCTMMDSKGKNHCSPDVLSNLPDNVIDDILMRVPFRDAVCTSILSKKWRYKWCGLPQLMLDSDFWKPKKDIEYLTGDKTVWRATKDLTGNFTACIHNLMTRHKGSITNFTLCIQYWKICPRIDNLLCFLSEKGIQHLVLRLPRSFELPSSFFTCLQLRHLSLQNCLLLPPPTFKGFDRLISLELHDVKVSSKLLECLISHCLLLEQLVLKISDTLSDIIEINAPMLRYFDFKGDMTTICLKYVPLLAKLSLWYYRKDRKKFDVANFLTSDFLESCFALEHLHLDYTVNARGQEIPTKLPFDLMCVKHLCMCIYLDKEEILSALCLIRSFPFLRYLEIQMEYNIMNDMLALECLEVEAFPDVISKHLREVKLVEANGSMREMQLIKLLLAKTPALVRMLIKPHRYLEKSAIVKRLAELTKFEIASPKAEVLLKLV